MVRFPKNPLDQFPHRPHGRASICHQLCKRLWWLEQKHTPRRVSTAKLPLNHPSLSDPWYNLQCIWCTSMFKIMKTVLLEHSETNLAIFIWQIHAGFPDMAWVLQLWKAHFLNFDSQICLYSLNHLQTPITTKTHQGFGICLFNVIDTELLETAQNPTFLCASTSCLSTGDVHRDPPSSATEKKRSFFRSTSEDSDSLWRYKRARF